MGTLRGCAIGLIGVCFCIWVGVTGSLGLDSSLVLTISGMVVFKMSAVCLITGRRVLLGCRNGKCCLEGFLSIDRIVCIHSLSCCCCEYSGSGIVCGIIFINGIYNSFFVGFWNECCYTSVMI